MNTKWMQRMKKADFNLLSKKYGVDPLVIRLMVNRGIETEYKINEYLNGTWEDISEPWKLKDMNRAVMLLMDNRDEKVAISSDFDCDGIFSAYILEQGLMRLGISSELFAPERIAEGYGLNQRIVDEAKEKGCQVILTCDNGIAAVDEIRYAKDQGFSVIVTDHHEVQEHLPEADAIINPKQEDCFYPFQGLCGAGVAFQLVLALYEQAGILREEAECLLPFVAMATIADVMELTGENRLLVKAGLSRIQQTENLGLRALMKAQGLEEKKICSYHIGFVLGPCFNASGRLETVDLAFQLLHSEGEKTAERVAIELKELNDLRKQMTEEGTLKAIQLIQEQGLLVHKVLIVLLEDCHESLVGIIAGRLKEKYNRPVIIFTSVQGGLAKGSGRSIPCYNMFEKLMECKDLMIRFGGHAMAAGMTLKESDVSVLCERLNKNSNLKIEDLKRVIEIDAAMPFSYISESLIEQLSLLEPFGKGNEKPVFAGAHFRILGGQKRGKDGRVLSLQLMDRDGTRFNGVMFRQVEEFEEYLVEQFGEEQVERMYQGRTNQIDIGLVYYPSINEYRGCREIEVHIQDFQRF